MQPLDHITESVGYLVSIPQAVSTVATKTEMIAEDQGLQFQYRKR